MNLQQVTEKLGAEAPSQMQPNTWSICISSTLLQTEPCSLSGVTIPQPSRASRGPDPAVDTAPSGGRGASASGTGDQPVPGPGRAHCPSLRPCPQRPPPRRRPCPQGRPPSPCPSSEAWRSDQVERSPTLPGLMQLDEGDPGSSCIAGSFLCPICHVPFAT